MLENDCGPQASQIAQKKYISHEFALRHLQPTIFISPWQLTWSQCSSTSRFSAELFGCIADCKACIAKKLRKQLGESFCLTPAQSAWRDSLNSIFLSPMSVSNIYPWYMWPLPLQKRVSARLSQFSSMAWPNFLHSHLRSCNFHLSSSLCVSPEAISSPAVHPVLANRTSERTGEQPLLVHASSSLSVISNLWESLEDISLCKCESVEFLRMLHGCLL